MCSIAFVLFCAQMKWCSQVFGDSITITSDLLSETLGGLDPSIVSCVDRTISASNCPIEDLITVRKVLSIIIMLPPFSFCLLYLLSMLRQAIHKCLCFLCFWRRFHCSARILVFDVANREN